MAKKEIRMITASEDVVGIIDRGAEVDVQLKNLTFEDKGIKTKLSDVFVPQMQNDEASIRAIGTTSAIILTAVERVEIDLGSSLYPKVKEAIENGILEGVVDRKLSLVVPPTEMKQAKEVLNKAGLKATIVESLSVTAEALRQKALTEELEQAINVLKQCVKTDKTYRIKYEKAKE